MNDHAESLADQTGDIELNRALHEISAVLGEMAEVQEWAQFPERDRLERQVELARNGLKLCWAADSRLRTLYER
jgi:hypothetical protein